MLTEDQIFATFASFALAAEGGESYIPQQKALDFISLCETNDIAVIGMEGFIFEDGDLIPQLDLIADYSAPRALNWISYKETCNSAARAFIENVNGSRLLYFSFTILSNDEH